MSAAERSRVVQSLTDMLQVLQPDAVSAVVDSLDFQKSVLTWKDALQSLPPPGSASSGAFVTASAALRRVLLMLHIGPIQQIGPAREKDKSSLFYFGR